MLTSIEYGKKVIKCGEVHMNNRNMEIMQYVQKHMEEQFHVSCQLIQSYIEMHGSEVWNDVRHD